MNNFIGVAKAEEEPRTSGRLKDSKPFNTDKNVAGSLGPLLAVHI